MMKSYRVNALPARLLVVAVLVSLAFLCAGPVSAKFGGSFGGGRSSFGGGFGSSFGGSHSFGGFGGGSFGGGSRSSFGSSSPSFGGSFGGSRSYSNTSSSSSFGGNRAYGSGTFGGTFGGNRAYTSSSAIRTNNAYAPSYYRTMTPVRTSYGYYGGSPYMYHYYGGWSDYSFGWAHPMWWYYTPFWPTFYYNPPYYANGMAYPGEFSWGKLIMGILIICFIFWLIGRIFSGGRNVTVRNW